MNKTFFNAHLFVCAVGRSPNLCIEGSLMGLAFFIAKNACLLVMGPGQKFLTRVRSIFCGSGRVSHLWFGLEFGKFPLKMSNFSIFFPSGQKKLLRVGSESTQVKAGSASYLLRVKSKLGSGRVMAHLYCLLYFLVKFYPTNLTNLRIFAYSRWVFYSYLTVVLLHV